MEHEHEEIREQEAPVSVNEPRPALTAVSAKKQAPKLSAPVAEPSAALPAPPEADPNERVPVCDVQFRPGSKIYFFDPGKLELKNGDHVILDTSRGAEYGYCVIGNHRVARRELVQPLRRVLRVATPIDERIKEENERREKEAYAFCQRKIEDLGLDMQLVSTECAFDGSKLLFFFTADARVDFRELVKILAFNFHTRIELRQIGVRDKAKMLGGLGICGRPFCCASFLDDFQPVSIKMAKTQNLSLNPTKISGTCGRLMCCLKYEQEAYEDLIRTSPKAESFVDTPDGRGTVTGVNLMKQSVNVRMEKDEDEIHCYRNDEIFILRSGKPKKNDPPIPENLAPISGNRDNERFLERRPFLDHRLTVDPEEAAEKPQDSEETQPEQPAREPEQKNTHRQRRERKAEQPEPDKQEKAEKSEKPAQEKQAEGSRRGKNRRGDKPADQGEKAAKAEKPERVEKAETAEKQPSRQQRRRQQQGKHEPKLPLPEQPKRPVPEKRPEDQPAPKPEGKKNNKRRYYHNRKPKG
ncbi:MAG: hypothetical protein IKH07_08560 [Oscillospiraceae bacterium]|nr:hypothetical protein [Oscillospiraceae bacterium]